MRCLPVFSAFLAVCLGGCAFIPTPVLLINKPHAVEKQESKGIRVCLIVKDERPAAMQKINMCGLMRNMYMIPTSIAFLAHPEPLERIVAYHLRENFEHLGFTVVAAYPAPPGQLSGEKRTAGTLSDICAGMKERFCQQESGAKEKGKAGKILASTELAVSPWGPEVDVSGADFVIEVKIRKFFSDCNYLGVFAWSSVNIAVCKADSPKRTVLFGRKLKGFGYGTGITPLEAYGIPINVAYWFVMRGIEKTVASEAFQEAVSVAISGRAREEP